MRAYVYPRARTDKKIWPFAHWFFDDEPLVVAKIVATCGLVANRGKMYSPTASYWMTTTRKGRTTPIAKKWCKKCWRWMETHSEEVLAHERLMEGA